MPLLGRDNPLWHSQIPRPGSHSDLSMPRYRNIPPGRAPVSYVSPESSTIVPLVNLSNTLITLCEDFL